MPTLCRTNRGDRTLKFSAHPDAGVAQCWLVDPGSATAPSSVSAYDLRGGTYKLQGSATADETLTVTGPVAVTPAALMR